MTLLLGALNPNHLVLAADGLCRKTDPKKGRWFVADVQKVYPFAGLPLAIAHHGQNVICGRSVGEIARDFQADAGKRLRFMQVKDIAAALKSYLHQAAAQEVTSQRNTDPACVIGFWIARCTPGVGASMCELIWDPQPRIVVFYCGCSRWVWAGYGMGIAEKIWQTSEGKYSLRPSTSLREARRLIRQFYDQAEQDAVTQAGRADCEPLFGGHYHQLTITSDGCTWDVPPCSIGSP